MSLVMSRVTRRISQELIAARLSPRHLCSRTWAQMLIPEQQEDSSINPKQSSKASWGPANLHCGCKCLGMVLMVSNERTSKHLLKPSRFLAPWTLTLRCRAASCTSCLRAYTTQIAVFWPGNFYLQNYEVSWDNNCFKRKKTPQNGNQVNPRPC